MWRTSYLVGLAAVLCLLAGCHFADAVKEAKTPGPDGVTPIGVVLRDIPRAIAGDPTAIVGIISTLGGLAITAILGHKVGTTGARKKAAAKDRAAVAAAHS